MLELGRCFSAEWVKNRVGTHTAAAAARGDGAGTGMYCGFAGKGVWASGCQFATVCAGQNLASTKSSCETASAYGLLGVRPKFGGLFPPMLLQAP